MRVFLTDKIKVIANACIKGVIAYNIKRPFEERVVMSTKRLQKLIFFCEIEYMKKHNGESLFIDEYRALPSGPVVPTIFTEYMLHANCNGMLRGVGEPNEEEQNIIDNVLTLTAKLDTIDLVNACCTAESPWRQVYEDSDEMHRQVISKKDIYRFYMHKDLKKDILNLDVNS